MLDRKSQWQLELALRELESELESESQHHSPPPLRSRQLLEFQSQDDDFFARISGFDPGSATSHDADVVKLHKQGAQRVATEMMALIRRGFCVDVDVIGREDPDSDPTPHNDTGQNRADAIASQIGALIPSASRDRVLDIATGAPVSAGHAFFDSKTHANRALNRRVDVSVRAVSCT